MSFIKQKKDSSVFFVGIIFIFLVGLFVGINYQNFSSLFVNDQVINDKEYIIKNPSSNESIESSISNIIPNLVSNQVHNSELVKFALDKINQDRLEHNLKPVKLGTNIAAQDHAEDMFDLKYFSHWNSNGVKPYVTYSQNGGRNYVQENIAVSWCEGLVCTLDPFKQIEKLEYSMVYDDASSNWGHRDTILNPHATHVNLGVSYDNQNFYYVQHFETILIDWQEFSLTLDGTLTMSGTVPNNYKIHSITIFEDPKIKQVSADDLKSKDPFSQNFYDQGNFVGILVQKPPLFSYNEECASKKIRVSSGDSTKCLSYETYDLISNPNTVRITANVSGWLNDANLKTIYINLVDDKEIIPSSSVTLNFLLDSP